MIFVVIAEIVFVLTITEDQTMNLKDILFISSGFIFGMLLTHLINNYFFSDICECEIDKQKSTNCACFERQIDMKRKETNRQRVD